MVKTDVKVYEKMITVSLQSQYYPASDYLVRLKTMLLLAVLSSSSFWLPRNLSYHMDMDRQACTRDTVLVEDYKSRETTTGRSPTLRRGGWGPEG
jgi:hypothetical protein